MKKNNLNDLEKTINYSFKNKKILEQALTHKSYTNEQKNCYHNEKLEFLGDAILQFLSTTLLFEKYNNLEEGQLTLYRSSIVKTMFFVDKAKDLNLENFIKTSNGQKIENKILGDAVEALVGAIYLDAGLEQTKEFVFTNILNDVEKHIESINVLDPKTELQEKTQSQLGITPEYELIKDFGPDHDKTFEIGVKINGKILKTGTGSSKQDATKDAADKLLKDYNELIG